MSSCTLCPRKCGADRSKTAGFCGICNTEDTVKAAKAMLHFGEEPPISGTRGSGAVFFSGCTLRCVFCQNSKISSGGLGRELTVGELSDIFLGLQEKGAHNINLVTASHFVPQIIKALDLAKPKLEIPVVFNCGGYESVEALKMLKGYIDIYLPDVKYYDDSIALRYSGAHGYFAAAYGAVEEMLSQTGKYVIKDGIMQKGVILRHLILPCCYRDSLSLLNALLPFKDTVLISLMSQYTPMGKAADYPEINRRLTTFEYRKVLERCESLGFQGFMQDKSSAGEEMIPEF